MVSDWYADSSPHASSSLLVCFSQLRWNSVFQRPQHLMTRASKNYQVIFWEEPDFEPNIDAHTVTYRAGDTITVVTPKLPHGLARHDIDSNLKALFADMIGNQQPTLKVYWYITPQMLPFSLAMSPDAIVYDNMDELSAFKFAPPELIELEVGLLNNADVVFTGGQSIFNAKKNRHSNIYCCPSSIDKAHFGAARSSNLAEPVDQAAIKGTKIGWFGVIDERFDIALLGAVAQAKPEWQFIMLGPVVKIDPATLPQADNIHWLGGKHYQELPAYLAHWQAGFMPFALNESTKFISPTKTPEYLAAGVPVVSTAIQDVIHPYRDLELVSIVGDPREAVLALESAIILPKEIWLSRVDNFLADKSWDATWNFMNQEIENVLTGVNRGGL